MTSRDLKLKRYLGDGVYAGWEPDSAQVMIWTSNGVKESELIAFEGRTLVAFNKYIKDLARPLNEKKLTREL
jgi:hypothetical protein